MRYLSGILLTALIFIGGYGFVSYLSMDSVQDFGEAYMAKFVMKKIQAAQQLPTPKMIIVAGSSAHSGISAEAIEESIGIPTYNLGVHAALGPRFLLFLAKQALKPGDTVLLAFEYPQYKYGYPTEKLAKTVFCLGKDFLWEAPLPHSLYILLSQPVARMIGSVFADGDRLFKRAQPGIGNRGDRLMIEHERENRPNLKGRIVRFEFDDQSEGVRAIKEFLREARRKRITVLATWPNVIVNPIYETDAYRDKFNMIQRFFTSQGVPVLGTPREAMLDKEYFRDTVYHLDGQGVALRTAALIPHIREAIRASRNSARQRVSEQPPLDSNN